MFVFAQNRFMFFDRNYIHIQAFQEIPPAKWISRNSSSSMFHHFIILSYYKIKKIKKNHKKKQILRLGTQDFRKFWDFQILRFRKSIFSKDVPIFFLYFLKWFDDNWEGYGSIFWKKLEVRRIVSKVLESIRNR